MNLFKKLLEDDKTLMVMTLLGFFTAFAATIFGFKVGYYYTAFCAAFISFFLLILYFAYSGHEKAVIKIVIGSILMLIISDEVSYLLAHFTLYSFGELVFSMALIVCEFLFYFNHLLINTEHKSTSGRIKFNGILILILLAMNIIRYLLLLPYSGLKSWIGYVFASLLSNIFIFGSIFFIEHKINTYKELREKAAAEGKWNEEAKEEMKKEVFGE